jgi:hypothetical protein
MSILTIIEHPLLGVATIRLRRSGSAAIFFEACLSVSEARKMSNEFSRLNVQIENF